MKYRIFVLIAFLSHMACTQNLMKRYSKVENKITNNDTLILIQGTCIPIDKTNSTKTIFDLSNRGQESFIEAISSKEKKIDDFVSSISKGLVEKKKKEITYDYTTFKKRIVFNVEQKSNFLGVDRILHYQINAKVQNPKVKLVKWEMIASQYHSINIGKVISETNNSFGITPKATIGAVTAEVGTIQSAKKNTEEVQINDERLKLSGWLDESKLSLNRYSKPNEDIQGNLFVDIEFKVANMDTYLYEISGLYKNDTLQNDTIKIKIEKTLVRYPNLKRVDSEMGFNYKYEIRKVLKNGDTYNEGDDKIEIFQGEKSSFSNFCLLDIEETDLKLWCVQFGKYPLGVELDNKFQTLTFDNIQKAEILLRWILNKQLLSLNGKQLKYLDGLILKDVSLDKIRDLGINMMSY